MADELEKMSFEQALAELEKVVSNMESGELPLDDMIKNFERGRKLSDICSGKLKSLEKKIEVLMKNDSGEAQWQPFDS